MRSTALILLTTAMLALAACGSDDEGAEGEAEPATSETTTTPEPAEEPVATEEEAQPGGPLLVIMDASGSMKKPLESGERRIDAAKQGLRDLVASLPVEQEVGLRVFGNAPPEGEGCEQTELISPVEALDPEAMEAAIDGFRAKGATPIGLTLEQAAEDLPDADERTIILVSDGQDSCAPPDPCEVASELQEQGIDVLIETVGFALGGDQGARRQLTCIAEATGGEFHDVADAEDLGETLTEVGTREERTADTEGEKVECGPLPSNAPVLELGGTYQDTILASEQLYCGFETSGLTGISAQVTVFPGAQSSCANLDLQFVDEATEDFSSLDSKAVSSGGQAQLDCESDAPAGATTDAQMTDADQAYLELSVSCGFAYQDRIDECMQGEYPVQFTVEAAE